MYFIVDLPWSCLNSFESSSEQVPIFYRTSTVQDRNQTKIVSRWLGQSCPKIRPTDGSWLYHGFPWARLTLLLMNKYQYFTGPRQFKKEIKQRLFRDHTNNLVTSCGQLMSYAFFLWIYGSFAWARSTLVLNKCQNFTCPRHFQKNIKRSLLRDVTDNVDVGQTRFRQLTTHNT